MVVLKKRKTGDEILSSMMAGAVAGALAKTTVAPLDRTKIIFQVSTTKKYSFRNAFRFLLSSSQNEGVLSLWRGNTATMVRVVPYAAIQFASHEQWKKVLSVDKNGPTPVRRFLAGSLTGITATTIGYPLDLARSVMAITPREKYPHLISVFRGIITESGFLALYRGLSAALLGVTPYAGCSFFTYETLKRIRLESSNKTVVAPLERFVFGACSTLVGQTASYPLDIVKKRLGTGRHPEHIRNPFKLLSHIAKTEGIKKGWYKGLSMNYIKGPIAGGIAFCSHDAAVRFLRAQPYFNR